MSNEQNKFPLIANSFSSVASVSIDKLVDKHRYSRYFRLNMIGYTLTEAYSGAILDAFYIYVVPYSIMFNLSQFDTHILMNAMNFGALLSLVFFKQVSENFTKKKILFVISIISFFLLIFQALATSFMAVVIARFLIGIPFLYFYIYSVSIAVEFFTAQNRGITINVPHMGQGLGSIFIYIILYSVDKDLSPKCLVPSILVTCLIPISIFIMYYYYIDEGPRDLAIHHRVEEATHVIENIDSFHELNKARILKMINNIEKSNTKSDSTEEEASYSDLFKGENFNLTISIMICKTAACVFLNGWSIALPLIIHKINSTKEQNTQETSIIVQLIIGNIIALLKPILAFASDIEWLGRIGFFKSTFIIAGLINMAVLVLDVNLIGIIIGIANLFMGANNMALNNYVSEVYPTKLRATANALLQLFAIVAIIVALLLYIYLSYLSLSVTVIVSLGLSILGFYFTNGINIETRGRNID